MRKVLTIAGSDSSGGAGIQADLKTFLTNGVYGSSVITAVTAQNTLGVRSVQGIAPDVLRDQIEAVFDDIRPDAVKIGMMATPAQIRIAAKLLRKYGATHVVVDPVMIATSGARLLPEDAVDSLWQELFPCAELITPNIPEAQELYRVLTKEEEEQNLEKVGWKLARCFSTAVLLKGGHSSETYAEDLLFYQEEMLRFRTKRIANPNTHGTGCTLSSAIAANLAKGFDLPTSVERGKAYITEALQRGLNLGHVAGPMDHSIGLQGPFMETSMQTVKNVTECREKEKHDGNNRKYDN